MSAASGAAGIMSRFEARKRAFDVAAEAPGMTDDALDTLWDEIQASHAEINEARREASIALRESLAVLVALAPGADPRQVIGQAVEENRGGGSR